MKVYIPTLGRPHAQSTVSYLLRGGCSPVLVVQAHEYQVYKKAWPNLSIACLPPYIKTISPTRQWILDNTNERFFCMMDDDLRFARKREDDRSKLREVTDEDMAEMLAMMRSKLQRYANVSISSREGNNRKPESVYYNERIMRVLAYDKAKMPPLARFDRIPLKQDFDMTLQLLRAGLKNCVIYEFANDQVGASNAKGGCSTFRTEAMIEQAAKDLQEMHPQFVKLIQKENSNWKGLGSQYRTEVQIAWKQAYEAGLKTRRVVA